MTVSFSNLDRDSVRRIVGGRSRYNHRRSIEREHRRIRVLHLLGSADISTRGWKARIAEELNVHRSTVTRDVRAIIQQSLGPQRAEDEADELDHLYRFMRMLADGFAKTDATKCQDRVKRGLSL